MIMASGPITSWQIEGGKVNVVTDFLSLGSKIIVDGDCSHEIKTLASQKENYDKPRHILKSEDGHKGPSSQSYGFSSSHVWI